MPEGESGSSPAAPVPACWGVGRIPHVPESSFNTPRCRFTAMIRCSSVENSCRALGIPRIERLGLVSSCEKISMVPAKTEGDANL